MAHILVVEDEPDLLWAVAYSLRDDGHEVDMATDGVKALDSIRRSRPDLIVLDIVMPGLDGLQVCRTLRRDPSLASVPILFLTVRDSIEDIVAGLSEGADDYLVKPFDLRVLRARVKALLRRAQALAAASAGSVEQPPRLTVGAITLHLHLRQVEVGERSVQLSPAEFNLMRYLMTHPGQVLSSHELLQRVWNYPPATTDLSLVRWYIKNLRAKIEPDPAQPRYIRTVHRHGYLLESSPCADPGD